MDTELVAAIGTAGSAMVGIALKLINGWAKAARETRLAISKRQSDDNVRVVDMMIENARAEAKLAAEINALRLVIETAVDARQRDHDAMIAQIRALSDRLANYDEFKKQAVYRPRSGD